MTTLLSAPEIAIAASSLLFKGLAPDELDPALELLKARRRSFPKGSFLQRTGEPFLNIGIVLAGEVECSFHNEGFERIGMNRFKAGETFGASLAFADVSASPVQIVAIIDSDVLLLDFSSLGSLLGGSVEERLAFNMVSVLAKQNLRLNRKVRILAQGSIRDRLSVFLSECVTDEQGFSIVPYTQTELASFLGVNRSALSREMSRMRDAGILLTDGTRMRLSPK